jgi:hypothetical protein
MKVTFATFHIEVKKKPYAVLMDVQTDQVGNKMTVSAQVIERTDVGRRVISSSVHRGRQIISIYQAKNILRDALIAEGVVKDRRKPKNI